MKERIIDSKPESLSNWMQTLFEYRRLIRVFAIRDLKAKYAQTLLGFFWTLIQPLAGLLVFSLFFGYLVKIPIPNDVPYPLFAFSGMISWYYFTYIMTQGGSSLINNQELIRKIYFPRVVLPLSRVITGFPEFAVSFLLIGIMMPFFGVWPSWAILFLPVFALLNVVAGLGVAIWLSAITIRIRDFHHIIPYLVNFGIWMTPVFYPGTIVPEPYQFLLYFNPMAGIIAGFRWTLLNGPPPDLAFLPSFIFLFIFLFLGILVFKRAEKNAADCL